jgi:hypothetical protein
MYGQGVLDFLLAGFCEGAGLSFSFGVVVADVFGAGLLGAFSLETCFPGDFSTLGCVVFGFV